MMAQDVEIIKNDEGVFDLTVANGQIGCIAGFDTSISVSILTDARAISIPTPSLRRGYVGDILTSGIGRSLGSTLWTFSQARLIPVILNDIRVSAEQSLNWMVEDNIAKAVTVTVTNVGLRLVSFLISITTNGGDLQQYEILWRQTYAD
jgi:phage gp46-like protein